MGGLENQKEQKSTGKPASEDERAYRVVNWAELGYYDSIGGTDPKERKERLDAHSMIYRPGKDKFPTESMRKQEPLTLVEEIICVLIFLFGFPGCYVYVPVGLVLSILYLRNHLLLAALVIAGAVLLSKIPLKHHNPPICINNRKLWVLMFKYFSFKGISPAKDLDPEKSYIFVAPPHGVIPLGNLLAIQSVYVAYGFSFHGMVASVVLKIPILRNFVNWWGGVDASRHIAAKHLNRGESLGLSTGGIAELFETGKKDDVIWLNRTGYVRLAFETGATILPCYLMGNTKLFKCIVDEGGVLQRISRKLQLSVTLFWGRWFLPVPKRIPVWGLMGNPIHVPKKENPTKEEVLEVHRKCIEEVQLIFDTFKGDYGWGDRNLLIKTE